MHNMANPHRQTVGMVRQSAPFPTVVFPRSTNLATSRPPGRSPSRTGKPLCFVLDNGLTVLLQENHVAPVVALNMWVKIGSVYERDDEAGISHVYEHML